MESKYSLCQEREQSAQERRFWWWRCTWWQALLRNSDRILLLSTFSSDWWVTAHLYGRKAVTGMDCGFMGTFRASLTALGQAESANTSFRKPVWTNGCSCNWFKCYRRKCWATDYSSFFLCWEYLQYDSELPRCPCNKLILWWCRSFHHSNSWSKLARNQGCTFTMSKAFWSTRSYCLCIWCKDGSHDQGHLQRWYYGMNSRSHLHNRVPKTRSSSHAYDCFLWSWLQAKNTRGSW